VYGIFPWQVEKFTPDELQELSKEIKALNKANRGSK